MVLATSKLRIRTTRPLTLYFKMRQLYVSKEECKFGVKDKTKKFK